MRFLGIHPPAPESDRASKPVLAKPVLALADRDLPSHDPQLVPEHHAESGLLTLNGGLPGRSQEEVDQEPKAGVREGCEQAW